MTDFAPTMTQASGRMPCPLPGDYVPATFEERGATVPFQKPELANARVRRNGKGELEALIFGFSGGKGTYVLPWRTLPDVLGLNLHDLTLHAEVLTTGAVTPDRIGIAAYRVARSGLGGEPLMEEAELLLADRARVSTATICHLLERLRPAADSAGGDVLTADMLRTPAGKVRARGMLALWFDGEGSPCDPDLAFERIQKTASVSVSLGTDDVAGEAAGPLRALFRRVCDFALLAGDMPGDAMALIAEIASLTVSIGRDHLRQADAILSDPGALLGGWDDGSARLRHAVDRMGWLLDGWQPVCDLWDSWPGEARDTSLALTTLRIVPMVPRDECGRHMAGAESLFRRQITVFGRLQNET